MASKVVQNTNLSCVVSKWSTHEQGYIFDPFIKYVTEKVQRRSPLINRGYYIRAQAFSQNLRDALSSTSERMLQIISLGAGFDTTYFRLKSEAVLPAGCCYYEIDFKSVLEQKLHYIKSQSELRKLIGEFLCHRNESIVLSSENLVLIGGDLYNLENLEQSLLSCRLNFDLPTIILSECVLNYMQAARADAILKWAAEKFSSAFFIMYEQICSEDGFGNVMKDHFSKIGSPLQSIDCYPDVDAQRKRFLHLGWPEVEVKDLNMIHGALDDAELSRVFNLEPFDEFEEFHLKCSHYVLVTAKQGWPRISNAIIPCKSDCLYYPAKYQATNVSWETKECSVLSRFGHAAIRLNSTEVLLSGGFGNHEKGHKRLTGLDILHLQSGHGEKVQLEDSENLLGERLFHQIVSLSCKKCFIVTGGRSSPGKVLDRPTFLLLRKHDKILKENLQDNTDNQNQCAEHRHLFYENQRVNCSETGTTGRTETISNESGEIPVSRNETSNMSSSTIAKHSCPVLTKWRVLRLDSKGDIPEPRWRHTATSFVNKKGEEKVLMFGGYNHNKETLGDCHLFDVQTSCWTKIPSGPSPRHSHSCVFWKGQIWLTGGLTRKMEALGDICTFDTETEIWSPFLLEHPVIPRYSHTCSVWNDQLFLIGGVTTACTPTGSPGIAQVCLKTGQSWEIRLQPPKHLQPVLLFKHTSFQDEDDGSIWIVGGGGNCFSFGTAFNKNLVKVKIK